MALEKVTRSLGDRKVVGYILGTVQTLKAGETLTVIQVLGGPFFVSSNLDGWTLIDKESAYGLQDQEKETQ